MATPALLRYLPARLKPLSSPLVWAPLVALGLLGIFAWEYRKNPDWANRQPDSEADVADSELTPEEQARLSEIDTLDVLLQGAGTLGGGTVIGPDASLPELPDTDNRQLSGQADPFGVYTSQYKFPGASAATPDGSTQLTTPLRNALPGGSSTALNSGALTAPPATANSSSALSDALDRQRSAQSGSSANGSAAGNGAPSRTQPGSAAVSNPQGNQPTPSGSLGTNGLDAGGTGVGNVDVPYIRTTTEMSPPVGTTGYRPPATSSLPVFNQVPSQPSRNPYSAAPAPALSQPAPLPGTAAQPGVSYTPPSFTQPNQTRQAR